MFKLKTLSNIDIDNYFKDDDKYRGCFAKNEIPSQLQRGFYIVNLNNSDEAGSHWTCIINLHNDHIIYFDSYGAPAPQQAEFAMKNTGNKKCYYNTMQLQSLNSNVCGYYCIFVIELLQKRYKFLDIIDMFSFDDYESNDRFIETIFKQYVNKGDQIVHMEGNGLLTFLAGLKLFNKVVKPRDEFSPSVRQLLSSIGDAPIQQITVCRTPIEKVLSKLLNWLSLGQFYSNMKRMGYDEMFHLYLIVRLSNDVHIRIEKNHVVEVYTVKPEFKNTEFRSVQYIANSLTLNKLLVNSVSFLGNSFFVYDSVHYNCQHFVQSILEANNLINSELQTFIRQDAGKILPGYLTSFNRSITDFASRLDTLVFGHGLK